eukprot:CAMPEP_0198210578 /NCGR_PEP_ID=MMETSP1445-20131203/20777_1 /TAXON_ID=36898 /ORGANISM="Pyramimonas sp., Strain CCMP2087" /LENGTH=164 /DNA_ID=CAMNT_0043884669 /DNA_START=157 /DNA_END=648 /DNA_ORIENTATION=+
MAKAKREATPESEGGDESGEEEVADDVNQDSESNDDSEQEGEPPSKSSTLKKRKVSAEAKEEEEGLTKKQRKFKNIEARNEKFVERGAVYICTGSCASTRLPFDAFSKKSQERIIKAEEGKDKSSRRKDICKNCQVATATTGVAVTTGTSKSVWKRGEGGVGGE